MLTVVAGDTLMKFGQNCLWTFLFIFFFYFYSTSGLKIPTIAIAFKFNIIVEVTYAIIP